MRAVCSPLAEALSLVSADGVPADTHNKEMTMFEHHWDIDDEEDEETALLEDDRDLEDEEEEETLEDEDSWLQSQDERELPYPSWKWVTLKKDYLAIVDTILLAASARRWELEHLLMPHCQQSTPTPWPLEELRTSPLGQSLLAIADYAGLGSVSRARVKRTIQQVSRALFGDLLSQRYTLPPRLPQTEVGKLFQAAWVRLYRRQELLTPKQAYDLLGIARQTLYDRLSKGKLTPIYRYGERRFLRSEIEAWQAQRQLRRKTGADETP